jgi:hypothetical protein
MANGLITIEITEIPDEVEDREALRVANMTAMMAAHESSVVKPRYSYRYSELGEGKIIRA